MKLKERGTEIVGLLEKLNFLLAKNFLPAVILRKYLLAYEKVIVYEFHVQSASIAEAAWHARARIGTQLVFREAGPTDIERIAAMRTHGRSFGEDFVRRKKYTTTMRERLKASHRCFIAEKDSQILAYVWVASGELYDIDTERKLILKRDEAMLYDWFVSASQGIRGKGIGQAIWSYSVLRLRRNGYRRAYGLVSSYNESSRGALENINGKIKATLIFLKILAMNRLLQTSGSTDLDLRNGVIDFRKMP